MKIKYRIIMMTVLLQAALFSSCAAQPPRAVLQDAVSEDTDAGSVGQAADPQEEIYVHICGAVKSPGVYALASGSRLWEAVEAAGGFLPEACQEYCNLAQAVSDGVRYQIPTEDEALSGGLPELTQSGTSSYDSQGLLDINLATVDELTGLPGIGRTRADAIITYREEHGGFTSKEDIMRVAGIKEAVYGKIEDLIVVH